MCYDMRIYQSFKLAGFKCFHVSSAFTTNDYTLSVRQGDHRDLQASKNISKPSHLGTHLFLSQTAVWDCFVCLHEILENERGILWKYYPGQTRITVKSYT